MVTMLKKQVVGSSEAQAWGAASAFFVFFFTGIFASTWLDVPFTYPTETFPLEVRARGNAFGTVGWGLGCGTVSLLVPVWFACMLPTSHPSFLHTLAGPFLLLLLLVLFRFLLLFLPFPSSQERSQ